MSGLRTNRAGGPLRKPARIQRLRQQRLGFRLLLERAAPNGQFGDATDLFMPPATRASATRLTRIAAGGMVRPSGLEIANISNSGTAMTFVVND